MTGVKWRYETVFGPEGEANYSWVYNGDEVIATMKTHHAMKIVESMNNLINPRHFDILCEAMAEVKATSDGDSNQSIADIVQCCIEEIKALPK